MSKPEILLAVPREHAQRFFKPLSSTGDLRIELVSDLRDAMDILADRNRHVDAFVMDNRMGDTHSVVADLRQTYPRLLIVLVDEEADFGMPGQADDISTDPFNNDDLRKRIMRLVSDRQTETLRADSLPAVRNFAKALNKASGMGGKEQAAVEACKAMDYDYVAYYRLSGSDPLSMTLAAQAGPNAILAVAPKQANSEDLMGWVMQTSQSRIAAPEDSPNHPLVARGRLGAVACVPVAFSSKKFGVLVACRERPNSITQENVLMLELVGAQLAAAVSKER